MSKLKQPVLSLGAHGTIGDALTFQKRGRETIARSKPIPTDPYSLHQAYQRWDYRDYAYLWTLLSNSEKQVYRTRASRYHITGFSLWMRENLKDLTHLIGYWKMDDNLGLITIDSSPNSYHAAVIGASPAVGLIDRCFLFDGLNDSLQPINPHPISLFSIEAFVYLLSFPATLSCILFKGSLVPSTRAYTLYVENTGAIILYVYTTALQFITTPILQISLDNWYHITATYDGINHSQILVNGLVVLDDIGTISGPVNDISTVTFIGRTFDRNPFHGYIDNLILYDKVLESTLIQRHSLRRYPL